MPIVVEPFNVTDDVMSGLNFGGVHIRERASLVEIFPDARGTLRPMLIPCDG